MSYAVERVNNAETRCARKGEKCITSLRAQRVSAFAINLLILTKVSSNISQLRSCIDK